MTDSTPNTQLKPGKVTEFLLRKAAGIIYLLRIAATSRDYIHDEIARCGNTQCLKQALYKLVRRYATLDGLRSALESINRAGIMKIPPDKKSGCNDIKEYARALHQRILEELAEDTIKVGGTLSVERGVEALLKEIEEAEASKEGQKLFKDVAVTLAILGFAPGRFPYVKCAGGE